MDSTLDTLVLSAAGRGVVQAAAHGRCVLVQCTIHKTPALLVKNSFAVCFDRFGAGIMKNDATDV
jgi:hypothetical protein